MNQLARTIFHCGCGCLVFPVDGGRHRARSASRPTGRRRDAQSMGISATVVDVVHPASLISILLLVHGILVHRLRHFHVGSRLSGCTGNGAADVLCGRWRTGWNGFVLCPRLAKGEGGGADRDESKRFHVD